MSALPSKREERVVQAKPFVKWVGGKGQLLSELLSRVPSKYNTYHEPFIGGGALFFALRPKRAVLSDINEELINTYRVVASDVDALIKELKKHQYEESYFYKIRDIDRSELYKSWGEVRKAARLIYLNKSCFNGLYRVNSKGQFNTPFGRYVNPTICNEENLKACSAVLSNKGVKVVVRGFKEITKNAKRGDFVYFDPPYAPLSATSSFTDYAKDKFGSEMQEQLKESVDSLTDKGVKVMLSNSTAPLILDLYANYFIEEVKASRAVNSDTQKRGKIDEIIVRNYD